MSVSPPLLDRLVALKLRESIIDLYEGNTRSYPREFLFQLPSMMHTAESKEIKVSVFNISNLKIFKFTVFTSLNSIYLPDALKDTFRDLTSLVVAYLGA